MNDRLLESIQSDEATTSSIANTEDNNSNDMMKIS